jgi:hypothetical protein
MANALVIHKYQLPQARKMRRAAQYVRMSTDYQRYSIENQAAVIAAYAQLHELSIVRTSGCSLRAFIANGPACGLSLRTRPTRDPPPDDPAALADHDQPLGIALLISCFRRRDVRAVGPVKLGGIVGVSHGSSRSLQSGDGVPGAPHLHARG